MAYFDEYKKKRMSRQDHLREDAKKPDEGREYRGFKGHGKPSADGWRKDGRDANRSGSRNEKDFRGRRPGPILIRRPRKSAWKTC